MTVFRKSAASLSAPEAARYVAVVSQLISRPDNPYGVLVGYHADMTHDMHPGMGATISPSDPNDTAGTERFLPWHRLYLLRFEQLGQEIDPAFFVPYWDWTADPAVPAWMQQFKPVITIPGGTIVNVRRNPPRPGTSLPTADDVSGVMAQTEFAAFTESMDVVHGTVHMWCNGTMSAIMVAPADPLFWLHHGMIDKLWSEWQVSNAGQQPNVSGTDRMLDPWPESVEQVASIAALGYQYV